MTMRGYYYNKDNTYAKCGISSALTEVLKGRTPIICCIGTDIVLGDSLGPLVGTMLSEKLLGKTYVYGTLLSPITAKDVGSMAEYLSKTHQDSPVLAIDAAVGQSEEIGYIKVSASPVKPGLGVEKNLSFLGDCSIIGILDDKENKNLLSKVRLSTVYSFAETIADGIGEYFEVLESKNTVFAADFANSSLLSSKV